MKLPNNQTQALKLHKVGPLKRSLNRLSKGRLFKGARSHSTQKNTQNMAQHKPTDSNNSGKSLGAAIKDVKQSKSARVALHLLLVRPWVLLVGFWVLSLAGGTLALDGMLSPRKLKMALPEPPALEAPVATSQIQVSPDSDELPAESSEESETTADQPEVISIGGGDSVATEGRSGFPLLPIAILVGGCATGCLVMSRRRAMARMSAARARGRARVRKGTPVRAGQAVSVKKTANAVGATGSAPAPKLKKRRQRVRKTATAKAVAGRKNNNHRVLASRATAQPATAQSRDSQARTTQPRSAQPRTPQSHTAQSRPSQARASRRQVRRAAARVASRRQPMVSVVPANESHSLDWNNGSLAHQMDVRQQRSAM